MKIQSLNLINKNTKVNPNYDLSNRRTHIELYFNTLNDLLIVGVVDNNYIYWASKTKVYEKEINEEIFNYIENKSFELVSNENSVFKSINISYEELKMWYKTSLVRTSEHNMAWMTPFGHCYGADQIENNGKYFANDVAGYLKDLLRKCKFREAGGSYIKILDYYLDILKKDDNNIYYYKEVEDLIKLLENENYLVVSDNEGIRQKYLLIKQISANLYNQYMSAIR